MPLTTETIDLAAEYERQTERMEEYVEEQASAPLGSDAAAQAAQLGQQAERLRSGIKWAMQAHEDPEVEFWTEPAESVTVSALTNGERRRVMHTNEETVWSAEDCYVAAGTVEAPYLEHDPYEVEQDAYKQTILRVVDIHPAFVDWAESKIHDLSRVGDDTGKSYQELVLERRIREASESENG